MSAPDAWAVRMKTGEWVGIWNDLGIAERVCAKQPEGHGDMVVPIYLSSHNALYEELIYAVGHKCPGETRHETALRYITQAEAPKPTDAQACAAP